jgi:adenosine kinase
MIFCSGSIAFDSIMMYDGSFADHIVPDALPSLNIAFGISSLVRQPGGTGHNIAYGLGLL